ncbi:MAG: metallophosphoesterase [Cytophagales bacterium]|nr:metallophosphoesterase [Cytophagales bacterium]
MKILHLTDFHYSSDASSKAKQKRLIEKFLERSKDEDVDFLFFTGDLTFSGARLEDFLEAKEVLLDPLSKKYNIEQGNVILCPGNHDVDRAGVRRSVLKLIDDELNSNYDLNKFVESNNDDLKDSHKPLENYYEFMDLTYKDSHKLLDDHYEEFFSVHKRNFGDRKIGIVSINTAWRAVGNDDRNKLLFPETSLHQAAHHLGDVDLKILLHHHPLKYLREFNEYEIEDIIHNYFDISFSGHMHKSMTGITVTANDGMAKIAGSATLAPGNVEIGFSILDLNLEDLSVERSLRIYDTRNEIIKEIDSSIQIPVDNDRTRQNKFRRTIRKKYDIELEKAGDLFVSSKALDEDKSFLDLFTDPVLKFKSAKEMMKSQEVEVDADIESIIRSDDNLLILGRDKCGKTSLLKKIQIELLKNVHTYGKIPYYIDASETESVDLITSFSRYYEMNKNESKLYLQANKIVLLIDNFDVHNKGFLLALKENASWANLTFRITADETVANALENFNINSKEFKKLHFHKLRKKHIRLLADKWPGLENEHKEEIVEKIESIFNRMSIPFNYWTVSLFLWIFKKGLTANFQNDVGLVNLYIESLLERENLVQSQASFGFDKYKKYLAHLAHHLLINHQEANYSAPYLEVISFTQNYLALNPRNDIQAREVWDYIETKGIIKRKEDDYYTFRLNGVFEYFLAHYMELNEDFRMEALNDDKFYLSFGNEFEFYAGFAKSDLKFLKEIYSRSQKIFGNLDSRYNDGTSIDIHLKSKIQEVKLLGEALTKISGDIEQLTHDEIDQLEEESQHELGNIEQDTDVKLKTVSDTDYDDPGTLEQTLTILGRVFKNIDEINDKKLVFEIFDYIIDRACFWGFDLVDKFKKEIEADENELTDSNKILVKLLGSFIPTYVQNTVYDIIGHRNVVSLIKQRIESLQEAAKDNQYKLFILFYLLADISLKDNKDYITKSIDLITIPTLKFSILLKINFYYAFKANIDQITSDFLKAALQKQQINFDNKTNMGLFHKSVAQQEKAKIHRKLSDK